MKRLWTLAAAFAGVLLPILLLAADTKGPTGWLPAVVSARGREIDGLYLSILLIVVFIFVITEGLLLYSIIAFRYRPGRRAQFFHGSTSVELALAAVPALILLYITMASSRLWGNLRLQAPAGKGVVHVQVLAEQFAWNFRYPGPDAVFGTADDVLAFGEMVVPVDKEVVFHLTAKDVIHSFFLPESRLKQDTVPGLLTRAWTKWEVHPVWDLKKQQRVLLSPADYAKAAIAVSGYKFVSEPAAKKAGWYQASDSAKINYLQYRYERDADAPLVVTRHGATVKEEPEYAAHHFEIGCAQLCGTSHFAMRGTVKVVDEGEFEAFLKGQAPDSFLAEKWASIWDKFHPEFNKAL
jgi:cytochrome c oxidase subunit 2